uniref:Uncharacterized protein n=1 Tax=Chromera velia CCMP2878 TaxID=1169474 RepID=A0A0G4HYI9_9ALVE|eukprot:Cvel_1526.t1-p1 / transcript=Cvel_1526.t1 / gene=Cvel_1526 / organism=Chromera_velia_CCMP2878 / gene_product=AP-5 complex subunit zeta-1, putative / transcript_product=AP-5 complex subunit zeta-1, putative / location=Cvel_scaffold54:1438-9143(+) / protein_length=1409 / sequence_SO=supercontig / SO=protein_coding / is_pseudo=false
MERVRQSDVLLSLSKLYEELKSTQNQTRDLSQRNEQHALLRRCFQYVSSSVLNVQYKSSQSSAVSGGAVQQSVQPLSLPLSVSSKQAAETAKVTHGVLQELYAVLVGADDFAPPRIRILCCALVKELSTEIPSFFRDAFRGDFAVGYDRAKVHEFLPLLMDLDNADLLMANIDNIVAWIIAPSKKGPGTATLTSSSGGGGTRSSGGSGRVSVSTQLRKASVGALLAVVQRFPNALSVHRHLIPLQQKFREYLLEAPLESLKESSAVVPIVGLRLFSNSTATPVTELDGSASRDFFTILSCSAGSYSEEQQLNVLVFSCLHKWLLSLHHVQLCEARCRQTAGEVKTKLAFFGLSNRGHQGRPRRSRGSQRKGPQRDRDRDEVRRREKGRERETSALRRPLPSSPVPVPDVHGEAVKTSNQSLAPPSSACSDSPSSPSSSSSYSERRGKDAHSSLSSSSSSSDSDESACGREDADSSSSDADGEGHLDATWWGDGGVGSSGSSDLSGRERESGGGRRRRVGGNMRGTKHLQAGVVTDSAGASEDQNCLSNSPPHPPHAKTPSPSPSSVPFTNVHENSPSESVGEDKEKDIRLKKEDSERTTQQGSVSLYGPGKFKLDTKFLEVVIAYSLRVLSQAEALGAGEEKGSSFSSWGLPLSSSSQLMTPLRVSPRAWQREMSEASAMEAVRVLDVLCLIEPRVVSRIFPQVKKVYERMAGRPGRGGLIFPCVLQFMINHLTHVIFDIEPVLRNFFCAHVPATMRNPLQAFSCVEFLRANLPKLLLQTSAFPRYFPAVFKVLCCHPRSLFESVAEMVPAMASHTTYVDLFHLLLDLPLVTALIDHEGRTESPLLMQDIFAGGGVEGQRWAAAFQTVREYLLRNESGSSPGGDQIWGSGNTRLTETLRILWQMLAVTPRVSFVSKIATVFLNSFCETLLRDAPLHCISTLVPALLGRFAQLYPLEIFLKSAHSLILKTLLAIFRQHPVMLKIRKAEICRAICAHLEPRGVSLVEHLCWAVGEYAGSVLSPEKDLQIIGDYFESLEALAYEAMQVGGSALGPEGTFGTSRGLGMSSKGMGGGPHPPTMPRSQPGPCGGGGMAHHEGTEMDVGGPEGVGVDRRGRTGDPMEGVDRQGGYSGGLGSERGGGAASCSAEVATGGRRLKRMEVERGGGNWPGPPQPGARGGPRETGREETGALSRERLRTKQESASSSESNYDGGASSDASSNGPGDGWVDAVFDSPQFSVFSPGFVCVIVTALTKLGLAFPEFAPRVAMCLPKMLRHPLFSTSAWVAARDRALASLELLNSPLIATVLLQRNDLREGDREIERGGNLAEADRGECEVVGGGAANRVGPMSSIPHLTFVPSEHVPGARLHPFELPAYPPLLAPPDDLGETVFSPPDYSNLQSNLEAYTTHMTD